MPILRVLSLLTQMWQKINYQKKHITRHLIYKVLWRKHAKNRKLAEKISPCPEGAYNSGRVEGSKGHKQCMHMMMWGRAETFTPAGREDRQLPEGSKTSNRATKDWQLVRSSGETIGSTDSGAQV